VALLGHPASVTSDLSHSFDALRAAGVPLCAALGPQHGMKGDQQDNMMETPDERDPRTGVPVFSLYGTVRRPTAALDRNLAYLGMVEIIHGYPFDGVVFTTGCDKTTPAALMAAATTNLPSICLNSGPMLDGHYKGALAGSGTIVWESRKLYAELINEY
jgi:hypothetical protein